MSELLKLARIAGQVLENEDAFGLKRVSSDGRESYVPSSRYDFRFVFESVVQELVFSGNRENVLDIAIFLGIRNRQDDVTFYSSISELPSGKDYAFRITYFRFEERSPEKFKVEAFIGQPNTALFIKNADSGSVENPELVMTQLYSGTVLEFWIQKLLRTFELQKLSIVEASSLAIYRVAYYRLSEVFPDIVAEFPDQLAQSVFEFVRGKTVENLVASYGDLSFFPREERLEVRGRLKRTIEIAQGMA